MNSVGFAVLFIRLLPPKKFRPLSVVTGVVSVEPLVHQNVGTTVATASAPEDGSRVNDNVDAAVLKWHAPNTVALTVRVLVPPADATPPMAKTITATTTTADTNEILLFICAFLLWICHPPCRQLF